MKKQIVWLVFGSLVTLSLLVAACAPKAPTAPTAPVTPTAPTAPTVPTAPAAPTTPSAKEKVTPSKEMITNSVGKLVEKPQFGGTLTVGVPAPFPGFDAWINHNTLSSIIADKGMRGDWTRSRAGTGELYFVRTTMDERWIDRLAPVGVTKWTINDPLSYTLEIRPGMRFWVKPGSPASGREITAEDYVFSYQSVMWKPTSFLANWLPTTQKIVKHEVLDRYTGRFTVNIPEGLEINLVESLAWNCIYPKDAYEYYGNFNDWRNLHNSGAYMIQDVVPGSVYTLMKNPNYWRKQPLYQEDTMPYIDTVKFLVIPDKSTQLAALRARKIDLLQDVAWEDLQPVLRDNPDLKYFADLSANSIGVWMVANNPKLPWYDKKVRHALQMAINREEIKNQFYQGRAEILYHPVWPVGGLSLAFVPLKELPAATQELFKYQPEKSKRLLAEAGYPQGFKARVITLTRDVDLLSLVKEYWKAIGVDVEIQVKEVGVFNSIVQGRKQEEMVMAPATGSAVWTADPISPTLHSNYSMMDLPENRKAFTAITRQMLKWEPVAAAWREFIPFYYDYAAVVQLASPYLYTAWQPWVKDYNGEFRTAYGSALDMIPYMWIDQVLKQSLTGRK